MSLFREIRLTNSAYCAAHGLPDPYALSDEERNGKTLSEPELERALVIDLERSRAVAEETRWLMARNPHWSARKVSLWAAVNVRDGISNRPRAVVEYAMPQRNVDEAMERFGEALGKFYAECRARPGVTWVGD